MITVAQIANATQNELLCITYQIFIDTLEDMLTLETEQKELAKKKSLTIIKMLASDLDLTYPISWNLWNLYIYIQGVLCKTNVTVEQISHVLDIVKMLDDGFSQASSKMNNTEPSMQNIQTLYAGMTYGKNDVTEIEVSSVNRGYKV